MSSAHNLPLAIQKCYENGFFQVDDPGSAGTISWSNQGFAICFVTTAGAESRALETASSFPAGTRLLVVFETDGGDLTITGSDQTIVLEDAGSVVEFVVSKTATSTYVWRVVADSRIAYTDVASLLADVNATRLVEIPVTDFRVHDSIVTILPVAAAADDLGCTTPTIGTTAPQLVGAVSSGSVVQEGIVVATVPEDYNDGDAISIVIPWTRSDAAATTLTLDLLAYRTAAPTVDINSTAVIDINGAASGTATFVLTPTNVVAGETILLNLIMTLNDGASTAAAELTAVQWSYTS